MSNCDFTFFCHCGCCTEPMISVVGGDLASWQAHIVANNVTVTCEACGCTHKLIDQTTSIGHDVVCTPKLDGITVNTGPIAGGTRVGIYGHCLDMGTLVVKFGGVPGANVSVINHVYAEVDTPSVAEPQVVDVTVENENGQRSNGGILRGAFIYS